MRERRAKVFKDIENMMKVLQPFEGYSEDSENDFSKNKSGTEDEVQEDAKRDEDAPNSLKSTFLDTCENHVKVLRLKK